MPTAKHTLCFGAALASLLLLTACSGSSSPSTADAKQAVQQALGDCKSVEIVDFEKVNGIPNGEGLYTLQVKYALKFAALESNAKIAADASAQLAKLNDKFEQAKQTVKAYREKQNELRQSGGSNAGYEYNQQHPDEYAQFQKDEVVTLNVPGMAGRYTSQIRQQMAVNLLAQCPGLPRRVAADYANLDLALYRAPIRIDYTNNNLSMIKSDNGWISQ